MVKIPRTNEIDNIATQTAMHFEKIQFVHHNTLFFSQHVSLNEAYDKVQDLRDEIIEKAIGYTGQRYKCLKLECIDNTPDKILQEVVSDMISFATYLRKWAVDNSYDDIENLAQSYSGIAAHIKYFITLSK